MQEYSYIVAGFFIAGIIIGIIALLIIARRMYQEDHDIVSVLFFISMATLAVGLIFIIINSVEEGNFITSTKSDSVKNKECLCQTDQLK